MLYLLFAATAVFAAQNYSAERDPPNPEAKKQYRLILRTPDRHCGSWRSVKPLLEKDDMLVSESKRDESGKAPGCRFLWVITPAQPANNMRFELEGQTGPKESFEVPMPGGFKASSSPSVTTHGVANENGTGPAATAIKGNLKIPALGGGNSKSNDMSTGF